MSLPPGVSDLDIARRAAAAGVLVGAGRHWFPAEAPSPYLRLSFAGARPDWIETAVGTLASLIADPG
jgi:DNA-binding transcriptional MocR family regulator